MRAAILLQIHNNLKIPLTTLDSTTIRSLISGRVGNSLAVELSALDRAAQVRILVPQPNQEEGLAYGYH